MDTRLFDGDPGSGSASTAWSEHEVDPLPVPRGIVRGQQHKGGSLGTPS